MLNFVAIDTETTGIDLENDRVIQFGCAIFQGGKCFHRESFYINAGVPNGGAHINKITDDQIASGLSPQQGFPIIASIFKKVAKTKSRILAYNAPFDLGMLANEFARYEIFYDYTKCEFIDPLVLFRKFYPFQSGKLVDVAKRFEIPLTNAHDAAADAEAAGHVFLAMRERYGLLRGQYLKVFQDKWHDAWAAGFMEWYLLKNNQLPWIEPWPTRKEWMCSNLSFPQSELW